MLGVNLRIGKNAKYKPEIIISQKKMSYLILYRTYTHFNKAS